MKAIINDLMYDTATATTIYASSIAIYKTENGAYFKSEGNALAPMTANEVKTFLGLHDPDMYISEFGAVEEA